MPLTDVAVRNAKPSDRPQKLSDGGGLHLLVTPNGTRLWRLQYRFEGKQKMLALGAYPEVSLASARSKRDKAKVLLAEGTDPSVQARLDKLAKKTAAENTFNAIADEYLAKLVLERRAQATLNKTRWLLDFARPLLGTRPISEISAPEVLAVLRLVERRGRLESARRLRSTIGSVFRYAIATTRAISDPTIALRGGAYLATSNTKSRHYRTKGSWRSALGDRGI